MAFLESVLEQPSYGWKDEFGDLSKPKSGQILKEFFSRLNVFKNKKNWLSFMSWFMIVCLVPFLFLFIFKYFSIKLLVVAFVYSMIIMGTHGTIWLHRYCTHNAYSFSNKFWRFLTQNLTLKIIPEEIYAISHHVHHAMSDKPGDPYNANGGFLYCFLADVNHQPIARNMTEKDYAKCANLMKHTGVKTNSFEKYNKWGTLASPARTITAILLNWGFWFACFYLLGGFALVCAIFGSAGIWAVGVRTYNYEGHGKGKDKRRDGVDHNRDDMSINQIWPGYVAGEWHNNHHLYPKSARSGFKPYQLDLAWCYIKMLSIIGGVSQYRDSKKEFKLAYCQKTVKVAVPAEVPLSNIHIEKPEEVLAD